MAWSSNLFEYILSNLSLLNMDYVEIVTFKTTLRAIVKPRILEMLEWSCHYQLVFLSLFFASLVNGHMCMWLSKYQFHNTITSEWILVCIFLLGHWCCLLALESHDPWVTVKRILEPNNWLCSGYVAKSTYSDVLVVWFLGLELKH